MPTTYAIPDGRVAMAATTYTGNRSTQSISNAVNGVSFQPDLVWDKSRSLTDANFVLDSVRGATNNLYTNGTAAEFTQNTVTAFNAGGFSVGSQANGVNTNAATYVAWQWKAGGSAVSNTAGSITSQVSANTTAGFSVVTYTGNATANATVGHGLGVTPSFFVVKVRSATGGWWTYHTSVGKDAYLDLSATAASASSANYWGSTGPTLTTIQLNGGGGVNNSGSTYVAYCFAPVAGYSAFGSYTGNGSADGPFIYTGFRPRFILLKRTDSLGGWYIWDTSRDTYNVMTLELVPNTSAAENSNTDIDALSNGFKLRRGGVDQNASGGTYIYYAVAENPFKYANAR